MTIFVRSPDGPEMLASNRKGRRMPIAKGPRYGRGPFVLSWGDSSYGSKIRLGTMFTTFFHDLAKVNVEGLWPC